MTMAIVRPSLPGGHTDPAAAQVAVNGFRIHVALCRALPDAAAARARALLAALSPAARAWADAHLGGAWRYSEGREALDGARLDAADREALRFVVRARQAERVCRLALRDADPDGRVRDWLRDRIPCGRWRAAGEYQALPRPRFPPEEVDRHARALLSGEGFPANVDPADLVRAAVLAPPSGRVLLVADWSRLHPSILSALTGEPIDGDLYTRAGALAGLGRDAGKKLTMGTLYGEGFAAVRAARPDLDERGVRALARQLRELRSPGVARLRDRIWRRARRDREIPLPSGHTIRWADGQGPQHAGAALSWYAMGCESDLLDRAILELDARGVRVVYCVHDSAAVECDAADVERVEAVVRKVMCSAPDWLDIALEVEVVRVEALPVGPAATEPVGIPVAEVGARLEARVREWLADRSDGVLVVPPGGGSGKSAAARRVAAAHRGPRVAYAARTHELIDDVERVAVVRAQRDAPGPGRRTGGRLPPCRRARGGRLAGVLVGHRVPRVRASGRLPCPGATPERARRRGDALGDGDRRRPRRAWRGGVAGRRGSPGDPDGDRVPRRARSRADRGLASTCR